MIRVQRRTGSAGLDGGGAAATCSCRGACISSMPSTPLDPHVPRQAETSTAMPPDARAVRGRMHPRGIVAHGRDTRHRQYLDHPSRNASTVPLRTAAFRRRDRARPGRHRRWQSAHGLVEVLARAQVAR